MVCRSNNSMSLRIKAFHHFTPHRCWKNMEQTMFFFFQTVSQRLQLMRIKIQLPVTGLWPLAINQGFGPVIRTRNVVVHLDYDCGFRSRWKCLKWNVFKRPCVCFTRGWLLKKAPLICHLKIKSNRRNEIIQETRNISQQCPYQESSKHVS